MDDLYLIYVHQIGFDYEGRYFYEFIFSDTIDNIEGEEWDSYPANGNPHPPHENLIVKVGKIEVDFKLDVAQNNELFSMYDSIDGIIPLSWQNIDGLEEYPEKRMVFPFGMEIKKVSDILYEKDVIMKFKKQVENE